MHNGLLLEARRDKTGKISTMGLLDLTGKLRSIIYRFVLVTVHVGAGPSTRLQLEPTFWRRVGAASIHVSWRVHSPCGPVWFVFTGVAWASLTCRQIYVEAEPIFWTENVFTFTEYSSFPYDSVRARLDIYNSLSTWNMTGTWSRTAASSRASRRA